MATRLQQARVSRGWTVARLIVEVERAGGELGVPVASRQSLKAQISRWENGHGRVGAAYRAIFRRAFGLSDVELGFAGGDDVPDACRLGRTRVREVTPDYLGFLRLQLKGYSEADNLMGPLPIISEVTGRLAAMERSLASVSMPLRAELLQICARYAEFAGWLYQDAGDLARGRFWSDRALDYAEEENDSCQRSYVLMRKSNVASDAAEPGRALSLAHAALRDRRDLPPQLLALALRQEAVAYSLLRDETAMQRALEDALTVLSPQDGRPQLSHLMYCTPSYVLMEAGACWLRVGRAPRAVEKLERALAEWPAALDRDRTLCLSRLALAQVQAANIDEACAVAREAVHTARATSSARVTLELRRLSRRLASYRGLTVVSDLRDELRELA